MITTRVIPLATATEQELLVEITENVCKPYCIASSIQPTATVTFSVSNTTIINGNTVATVLANITIVTPSTSGCGCAHTQVFTETFDVPFNSNGTNTVTLAEGASQVTKPANVKCCKASGITLTTTLTASIA